MGVCCSPPPRLPPPCPVLAIFGDLGVKILREPWNVAPKDSLDGEDPVGVWLRYDCDNPEIGGIVYGGGTEVFGDCVSLGRRLDVTPLSGFSMVWTPTARGVGGYRSSASEELVKVVDSRKDEAKFLTCWVGVGTANLGSGCLSYPTP